MKDEVDLLYELIINQDYNSFDLQSEILLKKGMELGTDLQS